MSKKILLTGAGHCFGKGVTFGLAKAGHKVSAAAIYSSRLNFL
jgi:NADP-dependent 3-hydroxy acid dehydrogenase YdfG